MMNPSEAMMLHNQHKQFQKIGQKINTERKHPDKFLTPSAGILPSYHLDISSTVSPSRASPLPVSSPRRSKSFTAGGKTGNAVPATPNWAEKKTKANAAPSISGIGLTLGGEDRESAPPSSTISNNNNKQSLETPTWIYHW
jgi:hypothetical protein